MSMNSYGYVAAAADCSCVTSFSCRWMCNVFLYQMRMEEFVTGSPRRGNSRVRNLQIVICSEQDSSV